MRTQRSAQPKKATAARGKQTQARSARARSAGNHGGYSQAYSKPKLWTKNPSAQGKGRGNGAKQPRKRNARIPRPEFLSNTKFRVISAIVICLVLVTGIDYLVHRNTIFDGITVGKVDVSGMTVEQAAQSISEAYTPQIDDKTITIYAGEVFDRPEVAPKSTDEIYAYVEGLEETEEDLDGLMYSWSTNATELDVSIAAQALAEEAMAKGRSDGFIFKRIGASLFGISIEPRVSMSEKGVESLAYSIDTTIGSPHADSDIEIEDGVAYVVTGEDGMEIDCSAFTKSLQNSFLDESTDIPAFTVKALPAPQHITPEEAQAVCDRVNASIANGCIFYYFGVGWEVKPEMLGSWIGTTIENSGSDWSLKPYVNSDWARSAILAQTRTWGDQTPIHISFSKDNGYIEVITDGSFKIPLIDNAISELTDALFGGSTAPAEAPQITIESLQAPTSMHFEDALKSGVVSQISTYTTEYTNEIADESRNHNIHLMGDLLNNSIVKADGGTWSFHGTAGESNEDAGFVGAGIILDGEYTEDVGGGICQTATTVFNAVYEAGYPILVRHNHSLYIASYPAGRDAAVNWPDLDLEWENDTSSDILLTTSYTDTTFTCTLYGVSPGYIVRTETGEWEKGEEAETQEVEDPTLAPGEKIVKQKPADGRKITVIRRVYDANNELIREDYFRSVYDAKNEIVRVGPEA